MRWEGRRAMGKHDSAERRSLHAVGRVGEVAAAGGDWLSAVAEEARVVSEAPVVVATIMRGHGDHKTFRLGTVGTAGMDGPMERAFRAYVASPHIRDPFQDALAETGENRTIWERRTLVSDDAWHSSEYVRDVRRPVGLCDNIVVQVTPANPRGVLLISLHQALDQTGLDRTGRLVLQGIAAGLRGWAGLLIDPPDPAESLPPRQRAVLNELLRGRSEKEAAAALGMTAAAVHQHVKRLYAHFGVHSRAELLAALLRHPAAAQAAKPEAANPATPR